MHSSLIIFYIVEGQIGGIKKYGWLIRAAHNALAAQSFVDHCHALVDAHPACLAVYLIAAAQ